VPSHKPQYGNFFKFDKDDILTNRVKTYPEVNFFIYSSSMYYNNEYNNAANSNTPNGFISLYELNVNRDPDPTAGELIYPFVTKIGAGSSLKTVSKSNYTFDFDVGDKITGSYPFTASISVDRLGTAMTGTKKQYLQALRTTLDYYNKLSPHYAYSSSLGDKETQSINLVSIPSIFYGSSIKKGSVFLKYYITGTLIGEASDVNRNGELIHTSGTEGDVATGSVVGVVLYNEGFVMLTSSADLTAGHTEVYDPKLANGDTPDPVAASWYTFGAANASASESGSSTGAPSSSWSLDFKGVNYVDTLTMFAHARKNKLNFSNNPTFLSSTTQSYTTGTISYIEDPETEIKNIVSSSHANHSASFKPITYISKVAIYDEDKNLIAIASLAKPVKKTEDRSYTFKLKLDM